MARSLPPCRDISFWHAAVRDPADSLHARLKDAILARLQIILDILYRDHEGGRRVVMRFSLTPLTAPRPAAAPEPPLRRRPPGSCSA